MFEIIKLWWLGMGYEWVRNFGIAYTIGKNGPFRAKL